jgi:hypothetical protein
VVRGSGDVQRGRDARFWKLLVLGVIVVAIVGLVVVWMWS